ncbi:MAG: hypothetical protein C0475_05525 [Planctomyces sp.]|nr:hypothetical protein [Planctomyces sp.]MBA4038785.1 hypothetical protein [Planctomyces sp.]MBA4119297.1 hypothetical protein [Isosphaera sp.]
MRATSPTLSAREQTRALIEFIRSGPDELTRRWVSVLRAVPASERAAVVAAVERRVAEVYRGRSSAGAQPGTGRVGRRAARPAGDGDRAARPGQVRLIGGGSAGVPAKVFDVPARPRARRTG